MLNIKTRDDEIKNLKYQTEKHDYENFLKSPKIDNECYKKIIEKNLKKRKYCYSSLRNWLDSDQQKVVQHWGLSILVRVLLFHLAQVC